MIAASAKLIKMWTKNVRYLVLFSASVIISFLVLFNLIGKQNRFILFDFSSCEKGLNIPPSDNPTQEAIGAKAPFTDRRQQVSNKTKNRY